MPLPWRIPPVSAAPSVNALTPLERSAVSAAVQTAVTQQGSLAPLFANLGVVASSGGLPPALQQAVAQVLAQRSSLDQNLTGSDVKNAFESSGLFLEASLASGSVSTASGLPDLKAALIVLRQTLLSSLGTADSPAATATAQPQSAVPRQPFQRQPIPPPRMRPPCRMPRLCQQRLRRRCLPKSMRRKFFCRRSCHRRHCSDTGAHATTAGAALNLLQEVLQGNLHGNLQANLREIGSPSLALAMPNDGRNDDVTIHTNTPPPPFRGALPSAQPIAAPSIAPGAPLATSVRHLLDDTDAAIARQTLLQVASLPGQADTHGIAARSDRAALEF